MGDNLTPEDRYKTMRAVKSKGTTPEKRLWAMLAGMRLKGWKKNVVSIAGKPDIVFEQQKVAIFIDGCFWHGCPYCQRKLPQTHSEYWERKIKRNIELAQIHDEALLKNGWRVVRIWEHEMKDIVAVRNKILQALKNQED